MTSTKKRIIGHTSIYMLGDFFRYSVSLIMLPIYTRYLTPEDYGVVELITMLINFTQIILGVRISQSVFRFYCTASDEKEKNSIISTALFMGVFFNGIATSAIIALSGPISSEIFPGKGFESYIILFSMTMFLLPFIEVPLVHIRARQKPWLFFGFSIFKLVLQVSLNIYFIVFLGLHVEGVIYSALISSLVMAMILATYSLTRTGIFISKDIFKRLFKFSLPLKLATLGSFYLTFGDRYFLNIFTDLNQVGLYALGYKFGFIFTLVAWTPFQRMWDAEKYTIYKKPGALRIYQKVFLFANIVLITIGLCISLFAKDLLTVMSAPAFLDAYKIVPVIIVAYIFQAWTKYCNFGIFIVEKTMHIAWSEIIAVVIITIAYITLIPEYGIHGAAWATVIGFAGRFFWANKKGMEFYNMHLPWGKVAILATLGTGTFLVSTLIEEGLLVSILARATLMLLFIGSIFIFPILTCEEKTEIWSLVKREKKIGA